MLTWVAFTNKCFCFIKALHQENLGKHKKKGNGVLSFGHSFPLFHHNHNSHSPKSTRSSPDIKSHSDKIKKNHQQKDECHGNGKVAYDNKIFQLSSLGDDDSLSSIVSIGGKDTAPHKDNSQRL